MKRERQKEREHLVVSFLFSSLDYGRSCSGLAKVENDLSHVGGLLEEVPW